MLLPRFLFALSVQCWIAYGAYVQFKSCDGSVNSATSGRSLNARLEDNVLQLKVGHDVLQRPCDQSISNFSATLDVDMLGRHSVVPGKNTSFCQGWASHDGVPSRHSLIYPLSFDLGSLPPIPTFKIHLQLDSGTEQKLECLQAELTPALTASTSATLIWTPRVIFLFVLLVGLLRYYDERAREYMHALSTSDLRLPGVADCLGYMQWVFLSGGLSLHYPGFLQPIASKLDIFSLFVTGPLTHGRVYPSVSDGIYSINGTYGGTAGLEHMHQIVGAPSTVDTWVNMVIAIIIISVITALCLEAVAFGRKLFNRRMARIAQESLSAGLLSKVSAILRVVLSYFTLPLSALSCYQLSASAWLPVWHTVSAALLVTSIILAFIWLFRRLPSRTVGLLMHETPKWYREQDKHFQHSEGIYVGIVVALTLIRGAIIGGLQAFGPAQLSLLAMSEVCLLFTIGWLRVHPWLCMSTILPVVRLSTTLLMICFVRGLVQDSARSAVGYTVVALHAFVLLLGLLLPAMYHLVRIACKAASNITHAAAEPDQPHHLADIEAHSSRATLVSSPCSGDRPQTRSTTNRSSSREDKEGFPISSPPSPGYPAVQYFRQPRHSSIQGVSMLTKLPAVSSLPCHESIQATSIALSKASSDIARQNLIASGSPPSSSGSGGSKDDWHDTHSVPLGPRWHDYTYREGDAFYGATPRAAAMPSATIRTVSSPQAVPESKFDGSLRSMNGALSAVRRNVTSMLYSGPSEPKSSGFEVVRPSRVPHEQGNDSDEVAVGMT